MAPAPRLGVPAAARGRWAARALGTALRRVVLAFPAPLGAERVRATQGATALQSLASDAILGLAPDTLLGLASCARLALLALLRCAQRAALLVKGLALCKVAREAKGLAQTVDLLLLALRLGVRAGGSIGRGRTAGPLDVVLAESGNLALHRRTRGAAVLGRTQMNATHPRASSRSVSSNTSTSTWRRLWCSRMAGSARRSFWSSNAVSSRLPVSERMTHAEMKELLRCT
jgi:hypothetical protein